MFSAYSSLLQLKQNVLSQRDDQPGSPHYIRALQRKQGHGHHPPEETCHPDAADSLKVFTKDWASDLKIRTEQVCELEPQDDGANKKERLSLI